MTAAYRLVVVDSFGTKYAELNNAVLASMTTVIGEPGTFDFTLPVNDPAIPELLVPQREVQVFRDQNVVWWGVLVRARADEQTVQFQAATLDWYFSRRLIGKVPKQELLTNGDFEEGLTGWALTWVPGSARLEPPVGAVSTTRALSGTYSLSVGEGLTNNRSETFQIDKWWYTSRGTTLTWYGKEVLKYFAKKVGGISPSIHVKVYHDNVGDNTANLQLTIDRAAAIEAYLHVLKPSYLAAWITSEGKGEADPVATNTTATGRKKNRRAVINYTVPVPADRLDDIRKEGLQQIVRQRFNYTNPTSNKKARTLTLTGWVFISDFDAPAYKQRGLYFELTDPSLEPIDPELAAAGYYRRIRSAYAPITSRTPRNRWVRLETSMPVPPDGKTYRVEVRLHVIEGHMYWDEISCTASDQLAYYDTDQALIIKGLVEHAQDTAMGKSDLNIDTNCPTTGVVRDRAYPYIDRMPIADALADFGSLAGGVEYDFVLTTSTRTFTTYYPRMGAETGYVLSNESNVLSFDVDVDGEQTASQVIIQTEGEGSDRPEAVATDAGILGGLILEKAYLATPGSSISSLQAQANRGLGRYKRPVTIPTVYMNPTLTSTLLNDLSNGDRVILDLHEGWVDITAKYRITSTTLDPEHDQISYSVTPEDTAITKILDFRATGWKYLSQAQAPITGASNTLPVQSNVAYAAPAFNDSGWSTGQAPIGWSNPDAYGDTAEATVVTDYHEVWMRKTVSCTGDMTINLKVDAFGYLYVNGNLITGSYITGKDSLGRANRGPFPVSDTYLDPSGEQVIAFHVQDRLADGISNSTLVADVQVYGSYDPLAVEP